MQSWPISLAVSALLCLPTLETMPDTIFYSVSIFFVVIGLLLLRTFVTRAAQRRNSRRVEQLLVEYLRKENLAKNNCE